jgi:hypothetical protein
MGSGGHCDASAGLLAPTRPIRGLRPMSGRPSRLSDHPRAGPAAEFIRSMTVSPQRKLSTTAAFVTPAPAHSGMRVRPVRLGAP